ncbi:MAG: hypothetical protein ACO1QB_15690 [Verrucomicrobiales bacterium]
MSLPVYIYVDVDDTFFRSVSSKRIPIPRAIQHIKSLHQEGAILYCWSSGGADYAKASAEEFGIARCFLRFLPKPNIMLDDQEFATWKRVVTIHPATCHDRTLQEYRELLARV